MVILTNVGTVYDAIGASKGLGFARIDFTGVTAIDFEVFVNKIGTGRQDWQLFNVTDNTELGVIADSSPSGDKYLQAIFPTSLTGVKRVRVRVRSTVSSDDPVYYGCSIRLIR